MTTLEHAVLQLASLRTRVRRGIWLETLGALLLMLACYALVTLAVDHSLRLEWPFRLGLLAGLLYCLMRLVQRRLLKPLSVQLDDDEMAFAVERQTPDLQQSLISALQFERALGSSGRIADSRELMSAVITDVRGRLASMPFDSALDLVRIRKFGALAAGMASMFFCWAAIDSASLGIWAMRNLALSSIEWPRQTKLAFVGAQGGVVRLPQGDPYTVRVSVHGPVPDQIILGYSFVSGEHGSESMSQTGDGEFTLLLESLLENATLTAEGGDGLAEPLRIEIVERPRIEGIAITIIFPEYMHKEPELVPASEGEIRLLHGSQLQIAGHCQKTARAAFVIYEDEKVPLQLTADGHTFAGLLRPKTGGLLKIDVIDEDQLGAGSPPKLLLRMVDDKAPSIDFKLRGISTIVTPQARIPGDLKIKDDFGLASVMAACRILTDVVPLSPEDPDRKPVKPDDVPFAPAEIAFRDAFTKGSTKYETSASIDLKQFNADPEVDAPSNAIRPGMLLSLRFQARDNFGPLEPNTGSSEVLSFRIVTREKMLEELRRRQIEQRQELERVREDERLAQSELRDTMNPMAADERSKLARARFKSIARQQQALGHRAAFVGEAYQRILWEFENNRLLEPGRVREIEAVTATPLAELAREPFPLTARQVGEFADAADEQVRTAAIAGYDQILVRLDAIITVMAQAETLAAILEQVRVVIKTQDQSVLEVERRIKDAAKSTFGDQKK
jgi:hypothetical protein